MRFPLLSTSLTLSLALHSFAQEPAARTYPQASGVFPHLAMVADHSPRTEAGIGAVMPWAGQLWAITYCAHLAASGSGTGLYTIGPDFTLTKRPESVVGTYANRFVHGPSDQLIIGPHVISTDGTVRTIEGVKDHRLAATCEHLTDPQNKVYFLGMEGEFWEVNVRTLESTMLFDLKQEMQVPGGAKPHFKCAWTHHGRVVVANNTFTEKDALGEPSAGRLAEWDGKTWTVLEHASFTETWGANTFSKPMVCIGNDDRSALLKFNSGGKWSTYRLPRHGHAWDQTSATEWMRIRETETERAMMDCYGIFYEMPYNTIGGHLRGVRPISSHVRVVPDFCSWRGMLVLTGNQATPMRFGKGMDNNPTAGQPQAGLWFGKTDDLWNFGKPSGDGAVWLNTAVKANEPSDPFLMVGFDQKTLHLRTDKPTAVAFSIEVDFLGDGTWSTLEKVSVPNGYRAYVFPAGFAAEWVRVVADADCQATAHFTYQ